MDSFVMLEVNPLVFERHGAVLALDVLSPVEPLHVVLVTVSWHLVTTLVTNFHVDLLDFVYDGFGAVDSAVLGQKEL